MTNSLNYSFIRSFKALFSRFTSLQKKQFFVLLTAMLCLAFLDTAAVCTIAIFASAISDPQDVLTSKYMVYTKGLIHFSFLYSERGIVLVTSVIAIVMLALKNFFKGGVSYWRTKFGATVEAYFGGILFNGFLKSPYEWHILQNSADLVNAILWRKYMGQQFIVPCLNMFNDILMMCILLSVLLIAQPLVSITIIIVIGVIAWIIYKVIRVRIDKMAAYARNYDLAINKDTTMAFHGIKDIKISQMQKGFFTKFIEQVAPLSKITALQVFYGELPVLILETVGFILLGFSVCIMLFVTTSSTSTVVGSMALIALVAWRGLPALSRVLGSISKIRNALPYLSRQLDYIKLIESYSIGEDECLSNDIPDISFTQKIRLKDVCFRYNQSHSYVLQGIDFAIMKGSTVGIVGTSGAGKSTLVDLLTGLLKPSEGDVLIDGDLISKNNHPQWLSKIGYVAQSPYIYDGTIAENVAYGFTKEKIDIERVNQCCEMASMSDFLYDLPDHVNSHIGERGVKISGGQKQRVAIARALYTNPEIMIFDEATSSLDSKSEKAIMDTIYSLKGRQTIIIIAHRLTTVENCDELIWLESGKVKMIGKPKKILQKLRN